ncbi:MAG: serine hydrolase domain-containing protein [Ferruginibacter sp.]
MKNKIITVAKANHIPTLSVLIKWKNDELKFLYQDKYKNIEPVNVYGIGSTTKFLCSLIFLKYVESGKINLEDPITDYIAKDSLPAIPWVNSIKVKHLLNHTSGIPDYTQNPSWINLITN